MRRFCVFLIYELEVSYIYILKNFGKGPYMKGDKNVIDKLSVVLTNELTAINQYFLHARMCRDWGYERIAEKVMKESIDEMKHAQSLIDRILFLEGTPNVSKLDSINVGSTVPDQFKSDLALEMKAIADLKAGIAACLDAADHSSREILEHILESEEEHIDWLESQLHLIKEVGKEAYLAEQIHKGEN